MAAENSIYNKVPYLEVGYFSGTITERFIQFAIDGTDKFILGADNAGYNLNLCIGNVVATNNALTIWGFNVLYPLQPAFGAKSAGASGVTGDGTTYTVVFSDAEYFDQNADFDGTSTFTAPVTGKYLFNASVTVVGTASSTSGTITLSTSNRDYTTGDISVAAARQDPGTSDLFTFNISLLVDMDASDTAVIKVTVDGSGSTDVDVTGDSYFNGCLMC